MKKLTVRQFETADAVEVLKNPVENVYFTDYELIENCAKAGPAFTALYEDKIIGTGGAVIEKKLENGYQAVCWSIWDRDSAAKLKRSVLCYTRQFFRIIKDNYNITKLRATWRSDFDCNIKWLEHLGFKKTSQVRHLKGGLYETIYERSL